MDIFTIYTILFFVVFLIMPTVYFLMKFVLWLILEYFACSKSYTRNLEQQRRYNQYRNQRQYLQQYYDRQGNIFTITDETSVNNNNSRRYGDFYYLEPNSAEAARIRAQLEKDEKDLPSYDDVIRMSNMAVATQTAACGTPTLGVSTTSIATTDTMLMVPPYSEIDPHATNPAARLPANNATLYATTTATPAAAAAAAAPTAGVTTDSAASTSQAAGASTV